MPLPQRDVPSLWLLSHDAISPTRTHTRTHALGRARCGPQAPPAAPPSGTGDVAERDFHRARLFIIEAPTWDAECEPGGPRSGIRATWAAR